MDASTIISSNPKLQKLFSTIKDKNLSANVLIMELCRANTPWAFYALLQYVGNPFFRQELNLPEPDKKALSDIRSSIIDAPLFLFPYLSFTFETGMCPFKKHTTIPIGEMSYELFEKLYHDRLSRPSKLEKSQKAYQDYLKIVERKENSRLCEKYEYGLSDW